MIAADDGQVAGPVDAGGVVRSVGMVRKCCRSRNTATTWISAGMIGASLGVQQVQVLDHHELGTADTWLGSVSAARNSVNRTSRPRNSIRANA